MASSGLLNVKHQVRALLPRNCEVLTARHAGQLTFYGAYHDHPVNVAIHMIFVPVLLWSDFLRVLPAMFLTCECLGLVSFSELVFLLPPSSLTCTP